MKCVTANVAASLPLGNLTEAGTAITLGFELVRLTTRPLVSTPLSEMVPVTVAMEPPTIGLGNTETLSKDAG